MIRNRKKGLAILGLVLLVAFLGRADEGMWMPHQMKDLNLKALGLQMNPDDLYKKDGTGLMSAVVNLGGGTGEFVSARGPHPDQPPRRLRRHPAGLEQGEGLHQGRLPGPARREKEIQAQGYQAGVLLGYEDVTAKVNAYFKPKMTPRQRYDALDKAQKDLIAAGEKGGKDLRCTLASMYSGNAYYLYTFKQIRDVRLVYAPPQDLGNFGGEVDNWMWPRHTCDFSFLRAYVAPDGTAADFSPANVPYKPKVWLKVSLDGYKEGDFTFVMGYPGRTYRNYALAELKSDMDSMGQRIKDTQDLIAFYEAAGKTDKEVEIRYASRVKGLYNGLKNTQGKLEGLAEVRPDRPQGGAGEGPPRLDRGRSRPDGQVRQGRGRPRRLPREAEGLRRPQRGPERRPRRLDHPDPGLHPRPGRSGAPEARQGPRSRPIQERNLPRPAPEHPAGRARLRLRDRPRAPEVDAQAAESRPSGRGPVAAQPARAWSPGSDAEVAARIDAMYAATKLGRSRRSGSRSSASSRPSWRRSTIPSSSWRRPWRQELKVIREESKGFGREGADLKMAYEAAILEMKKGTYPPDANGTIRFTYGPVLGYSPKDAVQYTPHDHPQGRHRQGHRGLPLRGAGQGQGSSGRPRTSAATATRLWATSWPAS